VASSNVREAWSRRSLIPLGVTERSRRRSVDVADVTASFEASVEMFHASIG